MKYRPSSTWNVSGLTNRQREHYEIAKSFTRAFTASEYRDRYLSAYPDRVEGSIMPRDHAVNNNQRLKDRYPLFLEKLGHGEYRFIGLVDPH